MNTPVLCVIDIQREYNTPARPFYIPGIEASLANAEILLQHARAKKWDVVHVQHLQSEGIFKRGDALADFIAEFKPLPGETVAEKGDFSSFSSETFRNFLETRRDREIVVIGYGTTMCCISTIIDGYHRGFKMALVTDASNAKPTANYASPELHRAACEIIQTFGRLTHTKDLL